MKRKKACINKFDTSTELSVLLSNLFNEIFTIPFFSMSVRLCACYFKCLSSITQCKTLLAPNNFKTKTSRWLVTETAYGHHVERAMSSLAGHQC